MQSGSQTYNHTKTAPLITIGITCFNAASTIRRAVSSAIRQEWPNKEIIVVDDGSTDASLVELEALCRLFDIQLIKHERNKGYPSALNTIIGSARGEFLAFFDDDDESIPERVHAQWSRIDGYERANRASLVLCYSNRKVVKIGQLNPDHIALAIGRQPPEPQGIAVADYLFGHATSSKFVWGMFGSCTLMARRETFLAVGPFDEAFRRCAEWDLAVRAAFRGAHFIAVDKPLVTQYKTIGKEKSGRAPLDYALRLRDKHKGYLEQRGIYLASRAMARSNYYGSKSRYWRSRAYAIFACFVSPVLLFEKIARAIKDWRGAVSRSDPTLST
jgi:glycosyltransferase involved in cell wall biosynthesis